MYIAIDDTYGPAGKTDSAFVTGGRRTHVAVMFSDSEADDVRAQLNECLREVQDLTGVDASEFHFVDIYNRNPPWDALPAEANLRLFAAFAEIYRANRWPVVVQTIDHRTLRDHGIEKMMGKIDGFDLSNDADLSLLWLLIKIKQRFRADPVPISLLIDEGRRKPGAAFGEAIFHDWPERFCGRYAASSAEPLIQIADFMAFCLNRSTHLALKAKRSAVDNWFLNLVGNMDINSEELQVRKFSKDFRVSDFDEFHRQDRVAKGLNGGPPPDES